MMPGPLGVRLEKFTTRSGLEKQINWERRGIPPHTLIQTGELSMNHDLRQWHLKDFEAFLICEERSAATRKKYLGDLHRFADWLSGRPVTKEVVLAWKEQAVKRGNAPRTVNASLTALNSFFSFLGWKECRVKNLKIQKQAFRSAARDLTQEEYETMLRTARGLGRERLALLMETMCATGIRVSEVRYITLEAARRGCAEILMKGKVRTILLPGKLCRKLLKYARRKKLREGEIFLTRTHRRLGRKQIWAEMKALCGRAGVLPTKVFPHNLRHLFAATFYRASKDVVKLADVLGHASIETTRIYLVSTWKEHARQIERLGLVH